MNLDGTKIMKLLLVEDNKSYAETLIEQISRIEENIDIFLAESRDSALSFLNEVFFDLVILDLEIPTTDGSFDLEVEHGHQVFYTAGSLTPGTPVYILTGSNPDAFLRGLARKGQSIDLWGDGTLVPTVAYYLKEDGNQLIAEIKDIASRIALTDAIRINTGANAIDLTQEQKRAIKVFTRANGGSFCKLKKLGGLSDAIVLKISVMDQAGRVRCECVGKLGLARHVKKEIAAYEAEVKHLRLGTFAPVMSYNDQGLRGFSAIFYVLADEHTDTFFQLALTNPAAALDVLGRIRTALARWSDTRNVKPVKIKDIRRRILSDENFQNIITTHSLEILLDLEERTVEISEACIHGDLHGGNILVNGDNTPVLIDFGDVGTGYTCLDPITLELSLIFHPDARANGLATLLESSGESWLDLNIYAKDSPLYQVVKYCREWAYDVAPHDESVLSMAYLFVLKQFKYDTVPPEVLNKILKGIINRLND